MTDIFYLHRKDRVRLCERLKEIPGLCEDLAITEVRQDRITRGRRGTPIRDSSKNPWHSQADDATANLHNSLTSWVRLTTEYRGQAYPTDATSAIGAARWLSKYVTALALTPGSEDAFVDVDFHIRGAYAAVDLPAEQPPRHISPAQIDAANRQKLTASQIEVVARRMGELGAGLNRQRVYTLQRRGAVHPCVSLMKGATDFYRFGEVLDAHYRHARRNRRSA